MTTRIPPAASSREFASPHQETSFSLATANHHRALAAGRSMPRKISMPYIRTIQYTLYKKIALEFPPMRHAFGGIPGGIREASRVNGSPDPATLASIEPSIGGTIRARRWDRTAGWGVERRGASTPPSSAYESRLLVHCSDSCSMTARSDGSPTCAPSRIRPSIPMCMEGPISSRYPRRKSCN